MSVGSVIMVSMFLWFPRGLVSILAVVFVSGASRRSRFCIYSCA